MITSECDGTCTRVQSDLTDAERDIKELREVIQAAIKWFHNPAYGGAGYAPYMPGEQELCAKMEAVLEKTKP